MRQLLCFTDEVEDPAAENTSISTTHMQRMLDMFVSYRVLDLLALVEEVPGLLSVKRRMRSPDLGRIEKTVGSNNLFAMAFDRVFFLKGWHYMTDWKALVLKFEQCVNKMPQGPPCGTPNDHIITLGRLLSRGVVQKILLNVHIASMHLADILALSGNGEGSEFGKYYPYIHSTNQPSRLTFSAMLRLFWRDVLQICRLFLCITCMLEKIFIYAL